MLIKNNGKLKCRTAYFSEIIFQTARSFLDFYLKASKEILSHPYPNFNPYVILKTEQKVLFKNR